MIGHCSKLVARLGRWRLQKSKLQGQANPDQQSTSTNKTTAGFTLIELLISALIAGLIISGLLGIVIELVSTNRRELARSETARDMGIAAEFMSNELREAVYVYPGECLWEGAESPGNFKYCPGLFGKGYLKAPNGSLPLIAFWKLDELPENCTGSICDSYRLAGRTYTLVVYFLSQENDDKKWEGRARITRGELAQFNASGQVVKEYSNPRGSGVNLQTWPEDTDGNFVGSNVTFGAGNFPVSVLVDYVDDTKDAKDSVECPTGYSKTPSTKSLSAADGDFSIVRSVYACVLDERFGTQAALRTTNETLNQKVILSVRGNPEGRYGLDRSGCSKEVLTGQLGKAGQQATCRLAAVKTEVLNRGTINKGPQALPETQE
jgi:type II secretory pathway pseudopilin PulG